MLKETMKVNVLVTQSCPTLCDPMNCSPPGSSVHGILKQEYWGGLPCHLPGNLPNPGTESVSLTSSTLHMDSLPSEPSRKLYWEFNKHQLVVQNDFVFFSFNNCHENLFLWENSALCKLGTSGSFSPLNLVDQNNNYLFNLIMVQQFSLSSIRFFTAVLDVFTLNFQSTVGQLG